MACYGFCSKVPENGHKESNGANGDDEDVDDEQVVDGEEQATEAVDDEGSAGESDEGEEEVDDGEDDDEEEDDEEEEEYGLSYLEGDDIQVRFLRLCSYCTPSFIFSETADRI